MDSIADVRAPEAALAIPRFEDGFVNMQKLLRQLADSVVNEIMSAEADQLCDAMRPHRHRRPTSPAARTSCARAPGTPRW